MFTHSLKLLPEGRGGVVHLETVFMTDEIEQAETKENFKLGMVLVILYILLAVGSGLVCESLIASILRAFVKVTSHCGVQKG